MLKGLSHMTDLRFIMQSSASNRRTLLLVSFLPSKEEISFVSGNSHTFSDYL